MNNWMDRLTDRSADIRMKHMDRQYQIAQFPVQSFLLCFKNRRVPGIINWISCAVLTNRAISTDLGLGSSISYDGLIS